MTLRITIDVFSGRPNPVLALEGVEEDEALSRLRPEEALEAEQVPPVESRLGYRGLIIEQVGRPKARLPKVFRVGGGTLLSEDLHHRPADPAFEDFVCGSTGPIRRLRPSRDFIARLTREREALGEWWERYPRPKPPPWPTRLQCRCAPLYEPDWWNDGWGGQRQPNNNCYNYGTDYRSDTFAQPGLASSAMYTSLTCPAVLAGAVADDLIDNPKADNKCPDEGHLVALVVAPGWDFHWYRKGRNGLWTHKPGSTPVTNKDNSGAAIPDPRTADRGSYTDFCTFMTVMHGHIKVA